MSGDRFDNWSRAKAFTVSRRALGGAGLSVGLGRLFRLDTRAQFNGDGSCQYQIELTSSVTAGAVVKGSLEIAIDDDGAVETGNLDLDGADSAPVVGQANGKVLDLTVQLDNGETLFLTGISGDDISECSQDLLGHFANPAENQIGTWRVTNGEESTSGQTGQSSSGGSSQSSGQSSSQGSNQSGSQGSGSGSQDCNGGIACGPNCCPSGSSCSDEANGICSCPNGTEQCGSDCVASCSGDEFLNLDTCECEANQEPACVDFGGACANGGQCCSGFCNAGTCDSCATKVCNDACVDTSSDNNNCGNCNNVCINTNCVGGVCQ